MSKTQKEIAAPKACNKNLTNFVLFSTMTVFTVIIAFIHFAQKTELFSENIVLAAVVLVILGWLAIAVLVWAAFLKIYRYILVLLAFAAVTALVMFLLLSATDVILVKKFTKNMLVMLISAVLIIALSIFYMILNIKNKSVVFALFCGLFLSIPQLFSACLPYNSDKEISEFPSNVWGVAGGSILAVICIYFITVYFTGKNRGKITTKWITYCATLSALSVVLKIMGNAVSFIPFLKFTLTYTPWVVSGVVLGPVGGMITACISDVLGQLILPSGVGSLNLLITLSNTLFALFPALMYKYSPLKTKYAGQINLLIGIVISTIFCTLGLNSFALWYYYYNTIDYWTFFVAQRIFQPIIIAVNYVIIIALLPALKRAKMDNLKFLELSYAHKKT